MDAFQRQFDGREYVPSRLISVIDRNPRRYINMQVVWIMSYLAILIVGLLRFTNGWKAGDAHGLALGFAGGIAGVVGIVAGFLNVNFAVKRLEAKIATDPEPGEIERPPASSLNPL